MNKETTELKAGYYYIKDNYGSIYIDFYNGYKFDYTAKEKIEKIITKVPSYEEYKTLKAANINN